MSLSLLALLLAAPSADPACTPQRPAASLAARASKYDSVSTRVGDASVKICYGRPLVKGRTIFGSDLVPFGKLWRTGANEPTILHTTAPITVAGVKLGAGSYSLYTVPQAQGPWEIVLNKSISQWGIESAYDGVKDQEVGRGKAPAAPIGSLVEQFTIRVEGTTMHLAWEKTQVSVPLAPVR